MRQLNLGAPNGPNDIDFEMRSLRQIEQASREGGDQLADEFTIVGSYTPTRELDVDTPSLANIAAVLATILMDMKQRGSRRRRGD